MALVHQTGSYCMRPEVVRCRAGQTAAVYMTNNMKKSKIEKNCTWLLSPSRSNTKTTQISGLDSVGVGYKQRHQMIVAASPPTEDTVVATEPLTEEDLVGYLASGCKPKEKWRCKLYPFLYLDWNAPSSYILLKGILIIFLN